MVEAGRVARGAAIAGVIVLGLLPLALLVLGALDQPGVTPDPGIPTMTRPSLDSFELIDTFAPGLLRSMLITLAVTAVAVPLTVVSASGAALAMLLGTARMRATLTILLALAFFVPPVALLVPRFVLLSELGMADGYVPLVIPALAATTPLYVALYALAFARLPDGVLDAARVAGAGPVRLWMRVALPLARPTTFAVVVLSFAHHWANLSDAVLHLGSRRPGTVSLVLERLATLEPAYHPVLIAAALLATLPPLVVFLAGHRAFLVRSIDP